MIANNILETIGNTPHIKMQRLFGDANVWIKSERSNPGGSIKDRIGLAMIEDAEKSGALKPGGTIIEPTSGNTGVGLAMVAAVKGYRLILVMPESMSLERRRLMLANFEVHKRTTAIEILNDFKDDPLDAIITGVGTGGHITGVAEALKEHWSHLKVYAVEPSASPVISGGQPGPHPIQGIGAGFIPGNLHTQSIDGAIKVEPADAKAMALRAAREEGMLVGISSGATLAAIAQKLPDLGPEARILGFNYDTGERYLSVPEFLPEE